MSDDTDKMANVTPLEQQLFSWEEWDSVDEGIYIFSHVTLKKNIGLDFAPDFEAGRQFACALVNYTDSTVVFMETPDDEVGHKYSLLLSLGMKVVSDTIPCPAPEVDASVEAASKLSHTGLLEAARAGAGLETCDEDA